MKKAIKVFLTTILFISLLTNSFCAADWGVDESGKYGLDKILLILNETYSTEPETAVSHIKNNYCVDKIKINTKQEDISEEYPYVMLVLFLPKMEEEAYLQMFNKLSQEEYTYEISKDYHTGPYSDFLGDLNQDGRFTTDDARIVLQYATGITKAKTETQKHLADTNRDGQITLQDATYVLKVCCNIKTD